MKANKSNSLFACQNAVVEAENALKLWKHTDTEGWDAVDVELAAEYDRNKIAELREKVKQAKADLRVYVYRAKPHLTAAGRVMRS